MQSNVLDKISFSSLFLTLVLLPIFFLPFTKISVETSKGLILVIGLSLSIIFWTIARFSDGTITLPKSPLLLSGMGIVLAFFLSAIFSTIPKVSLFGVIFEIGTFWFIFAAFLLMFMSTIFFKDSKKGTMLLISVLTSITLALVFQILYLVFPEALSLGVLTEKTFNLIGSWNSLGLLAGFLGIMSLFLKEFFDFSKVVGFILIFLIAFSIITLATVNFSLGWIIFCVFALLVFVYKASLSFNQRGEDVGRSRMPVLPLILILISMLFIFSGQLVSGYLPGKLGLEAAEISPNFYATIEVAKRALIESPILGVGPNKFNEAWALYKPETINSGQFWDVSFDSGSGTLLSFAVTTGGLGIASILAFFVLFMIMGVKSIFTSIQSGTNQATTTFFFAALYFFTSSALYSVGSAFFLLGLAFTGVFIGLYSSRHPSGAISTSLLNDPRKSFISLFLLVFVMIACAAASFKYLQRFVSTAYFAKAVYAESLEESELAINKARSLYQNDLYWRTHTQVYFNKLNTLGSKEGALTATDRVALQESFDQAVLGARSAVEYNPGNYLNFQLLGSLYGAVAPLRVPGASDLAVEAYKEAIALNPTNPGLHLALAKVYSASGKSKEGREYGEKAVALKPDYADALNYLKSFTTPSVRASLEVNEESPGGGDN